MARLHTYSQHFLRDPKLVAELIGHSNIRKNDIVYDLGAGSGVITSVLARRCRAVIAVEIEPRALSSLQSNVGTLDNVTIVKENILSLHPSEDSYKIFANIPFSLSSQVVRKFTTEAHPPKAMYLIVQKQFAKKLVPGNDHFTSQLSAEIGPFFTTRIRKPLRKSDFTPPPAVDTVLLEIKSRETPCISPAERQNYTDFVHRCFSEQKSFIGTPRTQANISPELRPSQLTLEQWLDLYVLI